ncbi:MAG: serine/threonine protein kinase, partial [Firmicutes bacterium]|nr:serine/threonine protein kinase [Bacillota bacterium]
MIFPKCGDKTPENSELCGKYEASADSEKTALLTDGEMTERLDMGSSDLSDSEETELLDSGAAGSSYHNDQKNFYDKTENLYDLCRTSPASKTEGFFKNISDEKTDLLNDDKTELLNSAAPFPPAAPEFSETAFGIYKILGKIGQGSGGVVYKALHTRLQKEVVIKEIISPGTALNRNETDLLKGIKHTYLPQVLDFIEDNGKAYTVMDFISGSDIDRQVKNGRKFSSKEIIKIGKELCEAVSYLHGLNPPVIHSDIKPANVMLNDNGDICLIDFNVSLVFDKKTPVIGGTRGYAPPEQLGVSLKNIQKGSQTVNIGEIDPTVNERSDVYSIGAFLYFMIIGEAPGANYKVKPIDRYGSGMPEGLLHVVSTAMSLNPSGRYKSAKEMLYAINNIGKLDKRYRALRTGRIAAAVLAVILMAGSVTLCLEGKRVLEEEHEEKYQGYIREITDSVASEDFVGAEELIKTASAFEPLRIDPYYSQTLIYYLQKD